MWCGVVVSIVFVLLILFRSGWFMNDFGFGLVVFVVLNDVVVGFVV